MSGPAAAAPGRIAWLDLARALSIVLVVVYHVAVGARGDLFAGVDARAARWWVEGNLALVPLRMPLFFAVSGLLAHGAVHRPPAAVARPRYADLLWPYLLWSLLFAVIAWPQYAPGDPAGFLWGEVTGMLVAASPYWFIAVLPVFFALTRLGRAHRGALVAVALLAYAAAPSVETAMRAVEASPDLTYGVFQLLDNVLWFVLGFTARSWILRRGERGAPWAGTVLAALFCALVATLEVAQPAPALHRVMELAASLSGLAACAALLPLPARWAPLARAGSLIGSRTLVIYLVHPLVISAAVMLWRASHAGEVLGDTVRSTLLVPALSALAIACALAVDAVLTRWGPHWLLRAPGAPDRAPSDGTARARRASS